MLFRRNRRIVVWHSHYDLPANLPPDFRAMAEAHPAPIEKFGLLRERLAADSRFRLVKARRPAQKELEAVHDHEYVFRVYGLSRLPMLEATEAIYAGKTPLDADCAPFGREVFNMHFAGFGGTLTAMELALRNGGVVMNLHGGFHHARSCRGAGFSVFNDLAAAARLSGRRTLIVDLDAHQGDGTASILEGERNAFTLSLHAREGYPLNRARSSVDIELATGTDDATYMNELQPALLDVIGHFKPELVLYQSGVDALASDELGLLGLSPEGLRQRDEFVFEVCENYGVPLVVTMGGGYSDLETTTQAHLNTFLASLREGASSIRGRRGA